MAITINPPTALHTHFFGPLLTLLPKLKTSRSCPKVSDADWLQLGICRAVEGIRSGRDFLQSLQAKPSCACPQSPASFSSSKANLNLPGNLHELVSIGLHFQTLDFCFHPMHSGQFLFHNSEAICFHRSNVSV